MLGKSGGALEVAEHDGQLTAFGFYGGGWGLCWRRARGSRGICLSWWRRFFSAGIRARLTSLSGGKKCLSVDIVRVKGEHLFRKLPLSLPVLLVSRLFNLI